jgi:pimeloyl-ACP methyl ester carboxylesterase
VRPFTAAHHAGTGEPLVCLHGFMETWRSWELVLPALEREFEVLAPTFPGHAGGPPIDAEVSHELFPDAVERAMDAAGFSAAHVVGNSLGGFVALQLAARGRARSVVALAPAGGWRAGDDSQREVLEFQRQMQEQLRQSAAFADAIAATPAGRRRATALLTVNFEHIPAELAAHLIVGVANCAGARAFVDFALSTEWTLDAERITCPVRVVWGTEDRLLPWPSAAERFQREWLSDADWVELDGVGHAPQLDVPLETSQLIAGFAG